MKRKTKTFVQIYFISMNIKINILVAEQQQRQKWKPNGTKHIRCSRSSSKREVYSNTIFPQETRKISNKPPSLLNSAIKKNEIMPFAAIG